MTISIQFSKNAAASFSETEKQINKELVNEVINKFGDESEILKDQNLLIYFGWKSKAILGGFQREILGRFTIRATPAYEMFTKKYIDEIRDITDFELFDYIIYLSNDIGHDENKISKNFTVIHELQHVLQYIYLKNLYLKSFVLCNYFSIRKFDINDLPIEYDALKKAKLINYRIFSKDKVDSFLDKKIEISKEDEKIYWKKIKNIDIDKDYNLENEMQIVWDKHEKDIKEKIKTDNDLRETYEFLISHVKENKVEI